MIIPIALSPYSIVKKHKKVNRNVENIYILRIQVAKGTVLYATPLTGEV